MTNGHSLKIRWNGFDFYIAKWKQGPHWTIGWSQTESEGCIPYRKRTDLEKMVFARNFVVWQNYKLSVHSSLDVWKLQKLNIKKSVTLEIFPETYLTLRPQKTNFMW
jgi:hypothetical protein